MIMTKKNAAKVAARAQQAENGGNYQAHLRSAGGGGGAGGEQPPAGRAFGEWWSEILARDEEWIRKVRNGDDDASPTPLFQCVFCRGDIDPTENGGGMLAWWETKPANARDAGVVACGLYHPGQHNNARCLYLAEGLGLALRDGHAEMSVDRYAFDQLQSVVWRYTRWEAAALRRMVLLCGELGRLKSRDPKRQAEVRRIYEQM